MSDQPNPAAAETKLQRWAVHYASIPHTCLDPTHCDCNCDGCVVARGFQVTVAGHQCLCDDARCTWCGPRIADMVIALAAAPETAKERVLARYCDAYEHKDGSIWRPTSVMDTDDCETWVGNDWVHAASRLAAVPVPPPAVEDTPMRVLRQYHLALKEIDRLRDELASRTSAWNAALESNGGAKS